MAKRKQRLCHFCGTQTWRTVVLGYCTFAVPCCKRCEP